MHQNVQHFVNAVYGGALNDALNGDAGKSKHEAICGAGTSVPLTSKETANTTSRRMVLHPYALNEGVV